MAANHIFGLGDVVATTATVVAILAVSAIPLYAQQSSTVQLKADAQNLFKIISSDKRKIQIFAKSLSSVINSIRLIRCMTPR
jgi:hypothetical protein